MNRNFATLAICFALGLATWVQASNSPAKQDRDHDKDNQARQAQRAQKPQKVKITHGPVVESAKANAATIAWSTNTNASTILKYGTSPQALSQTAEARWGGTTHRVQLRNLKPGTTYYYRVESTQAQGTGSQALSAVEQFRTQGPAPAAAAATKPASVKLTHGPVVESVNTTAATIAWSTNTNASTILKYGANPAALNETAEAPWGGRTHRVHLRSLKPGTTYYYRVESTQAQGTGTQAVSPVEKFRTRGNVTAAAQPAQAANPRQRALRNFHQFLATHPNIKTDLKRNPELARNGRYMVQHPGFNQFVQTHPGVKQYLAAILRAKRRADAVREARKAGGRQAASLFLFVASRPVLPPEV